MTESKTVIFDLDGTLIEPSEAICKSINYALKKHGYKELSHTDLRPYIGMHLIEPFADITGSGDEKHLWELIDSYRERYETVGIVENYLYPGISDMLKSLDSKNFIASIKPADASKMVLDHLNMAKYFSGFYGSEKDGTRADKTELLHYLKKQEDIKDAIMIGDRHTDIKAAKSCGFGSIGVTYGYGDAEEIKESNPDLIVESPEDLERYILKLWKN